MKKISKLVVGLLSLSSFVGEKAVANDFLDRVLNQNNDDSSETELRLNSDVELLLDQKLDELSKDDLKEIIERNILDSKKPSTLLNENHGINIRDIREEVGSYEHVGV